MDDAVSRSRNRSHHFVREMRMLIDDAFEIFTLEAENMRLAKRTQGDGMFVAVDKAEFARKIAFSEDGKAGDVTASGVFDYLEFALQEHM